MFKRIVIKPSQGILGVLLLALSLAGCGQKAPLEPAPLPEPNTPEQAAADAEDSQ